MPNLTGRYPIWYPVPGSPLIPFEDNFLAIAQSIANTLNGYDLPIGVGSQTERDNLFPTPAHGNSVFRRDLGYAETYFGAYNSSTNPGGMPAAGWRRTSDRSYLHGTFSGTTNGSGDVVVAHGLPVTPSRVFISQGAGGSSPERRTFAAYAKGGANFSVRTYRSDTGSFFANVPVEFDWIAYV